MFLFSLCLPSMPLLSLCHSVCLFVPVLLGIKKRKKRTGRGTLLRRKEVANDKPPSLPPSYYSHERTSSFFFTLALTAS
ncbi:MAG: hypothetical protein J3R72DRAFT_209452 [Linnemannia gamsii]|nr:MAG: hypothetical protein J3R72DRAFT_209452 [Linnemannia gamsii]